MVKKLEIRWGRGEEVKWRMNAAPSSDWFIASPGSCRLPAQQLPPAANGQFVGFTVTLPVGMVET